MSTASAQRITEVINEKTDLKDPENPVMEVPDGSIVFDHVDFSYRKDSREPVLKDINLSIRSGETIGIIGGTGSAKSSLVNLISRLYDVSAGSVSVGGIDVRAYQMDALRNQVSVVLQKMSCFPERFWKTSAGAIKMLRRKNAAMPVSLPVRMILLKKCPKNTTPILNRAEQTSPAVKSSVSVLPERSLRNRKS